MKLTFLHLHLTPISSTNKHLLETTDQGVVCQCMHCPLHPQQRGHGHLSLAMPVAKYIIAAGIMFQLPAHPGLVPVHAAGANAAMQQENIRLFNATIKELTIATMVQEETKKQLLTAVDRLYLAALGNDSFGFFRIT